MESVNHKEHLRQVVQQQRELSAEVDTKQRLLIKLQGIIEYLTEIGVTLDDENPTDQSETVVEEASATEDETVES
jgi:hypothetical protein|tara:strand:- start:1054 stop:1278 length:225 start_codon:yes stop_codon:yes gene_type:complete